MLHAALLAQPGRACAHRAALMCPAALQRPGVVAVYTAADLGDYWQPGPLLVPPPPIDGIVFNAAHPGAAGKGQGSPCRRAGRARDRRKPLSRRGRARRYRGRTRATAGGRRSGTRRSARLRAGARRSRLQHRRACPADARATMPPRPRSAPIASSGGASSTTTALRRRWRRAAWWRNGMRAPTDDDLGYDAGAGVRPQRPGRHARAERAAGARDRAVRRRRLRPEDHDVLSRGGAAAVGRDASSTGRSNGSRTGWSISSPRPTSAARSTMPRSRSPAMAASSASRTCSCMTPAPTIPTG